MADFRAVQRVRLYDGSNDIGFDSGNPFYVSAVLPANDGVDIGDVTVNNAGGASAVNIQDGGNSITVDGTVAATQSGSWDIGTVTTLTGITNDVNIADGGNSITVDASNLDIRDLTAASDNVLIYANTAKDGTGTNYVPLVDGDGKLIISNPSGSTEYTEDAVAPAAASGNAPMAERDDALGGITPAEGDWSKLYVNANGALWVKHDGDMTISDGGNTITVDGTVAATQSGSWDIGTVTTLTSITNDVNIADGGNSITVDDGGLTISIDDGGGTITVDGTVAVSSVAGNVTVVATDLDIRALDHVTIGDSVRIGDGTETLNITAAGEAEVDIAAQSLTALKISKDANANTELNPIFVQTVNTVTSGEEIHDFDSATVAKDATDNHDYTVAGTTFLLKSVIVAASGAGKYEIQAGPVASLVTKAVAFTSASRPTDQLFFDPPIEVPVTSTGTVRVIRRNDDNQSMDMYSTIIGSDV